MCTEARRLAYTDREAAARKEQQPTPLRGWGAASYRGAPARTSAAAARKPQPQVSPCIVYQRALPTTGHTHKHSQQAAASAHPQAGFERPPTHPTTTPPHPQTPSKKYPHPRTFEMVKNLHPRYKSRNTSQKPFLSNARNTLRWSLSCRERAPIGLQRRTAD
jgi:hypothetical protein